MTLTSPSAFVGPVKSQVTALGNLGTTETINAATVEDGWYTGTLDANCVLTVSNLAAGARLKLILSQAGPGGKTLTLSDGTSSAAVTVGSGSSAVTIVDVVGAGGILYFQATVGGGVVVTTPGGALGGSVPDLHTWNITSELYVGGSGASDSNAGTSAAPFATLQGAHDYLKTTHTWPSTGDVAVNVRTGTYKAANTLQATLDTTFTGTTRAPTSTRYLIWRVASGHEGGVTINNPSGTASDRYAVRVGSNAANSHQIFYGFNIDGEQTIKGPATGSGGGSCGFYFSGTTTDSNTRCEVLFCTIHGLRANTSQSMQAITTDDGSSHLKVAFNRFYDNGNVGSTLANQEHQIYLHAPDSVVMGNLFESSPNGYAIQYYDGNTPTLGYHRAQILCNTINLCRKSGIVIHATTTSVIVRGNIFSNNTEYGIEFFPTGTGTTCVVDRNHYYNNTAGNRDESPTGWTFTNETSGDPLYTTGLFTLQAGSPCKGIGDADWTPTVDLTGATRSVANLGAYA